MRKRERKREREGGREGGRERDLSVVFEVDGRAGAVGKDDASGAGAHFVGSIDAHFNLGHVLIYGLTFRP